MHDALAEWTAMRDEAQHCRACDLWRPATQTVFGEGPIHAPLMLVGEQPGDKEDIAGKPFIGPAGPILDLALGDARVARDEAYVTNAVKHFKFARRGKVRLHQKPGDGRNRGALHLRNSLADRMQSRPPA